MDEGLLQAMKEGFTLSDIEKKYSGSQIVVTGGAGCIGSNLVKRLGVLEAGEIVVIDDLSSGYRWNIPKAPAVRFVEGSILKDDVLEEAFSKRPDIVFHLAAHFANQNSVDHPEEDLMVNGLGILKVLEFSRRSRVSRFVYSSSGCGVYGLESKMPFREHDISIRLHTPYQVTKLLGELYTNFFHNLYDLPIVNARFFNVFGPGEVPGKYRNVIPNFMYWALQRKPLPITGDGLETRDWTYVGDIVDGLISMGIVPAAIGEAINLGSGAETRVIDMATMINEITGNTKGVTYLNRRNWDVKTRLRSSIRKAESILGYHPTTNFEKGLQQVFYWFKETWDLIERSAEFPDAP